MIRVTDHITLDPDEFEVSFIRASGPGGQNVNKVASAVQLRFDAAHSTSLSEPVRHRLIKLAGRRATRDGVIVIEAKRYRLQARNRADAIARLVALVESAAHAAPQRRASKPPRAATKKRLEQKRGRGAIKKLRRRPAADAV